MVLEYLCDLGGKCLNSQSFLILAERMWDNKTTPRHERKRFSPCSTSGSRQILWGCPQLVFPFTLRSRAMVSPSPWWSGAWSLLKDTCQHLYFLFNVLYLCQFWFLKFQKCTCCIHVFVDSLHLSNGESPE